MGCGSSRRMDREDESQPAETRSRSHPVGATWPVAVRSVVRNSQQSSPPRLDVLLDCPTGQEESDDGFEPNHPERCGRPQCAFALQLGLDQRTSASAARWGAPRRVDRASPLRITCAPSVCEGSLGVARATQSEPSSANRPMKARATVSCGSGGVRRERVGCANPALRPARPASGGRSRAARG